MECGGGFLPAVMQQVILTLHFEGKNQRRTGVIQGEKRETVGFSQFSFLFSLIFSQTPILSIYLTYT